MNFGVKRYINAVDLGQNSIKIIQLQKMRRSWHISQQVSHPSPGLEALERGNVADLAASLQEAAAIAGISKSKVISFIGGQRVITRQITMPPMPWDDLQKAVIWEAEKIIPIPVADLEIRPVVLEEKLSELGEVTQLHVLMVAASKSLIYRFNEIFDRAGLTLTAIDLPALNLWRVFAQGYCVPQPKEIQAVVDIGSQTSHFIVIKHNILSYVRSLSVNLAPADLSPNINDDDFQIIQEVAAGNELTGSHLYMPAGLVDDDSLYAQLVTEIRRSLDFYRLQERDTIIEQLVITGGGSQLTGLDQILQAELGLPVVVGYPALPTGPDKIQELHPQFTMAFGLALREVKV
ncbi:type IV pilus assembly protein PilM [Desulfotomaculum nigrificans CO-1-SRB]|uniref:Type IV pilus assembly protein PilM n=1 Tax=Desulfotomaculum nigrificans (strain DSM 14880 / VKM B-2319 / CO-1-SRB) TaxID=868595 RepID=F6BA42_DESCC|nr:type IV pilus assembly protein PilM [Desulfotomaculum nigrificans]AEF95011.1 type IV pilus assembly protein PilM [Desulfotomaculum nigrificans CO-1-SRB]